MGAEEDERSWREFAHDLVSQVEDLGELHHQAG
jgi:hypothetical protein